METDLKFNSKEASSMKHKIPEFPDTLRYQANRVLGILKTDNELLRYEIETALQIMFIKGYEAAQKDIANRKITLKQIKETQHG